MDAAKTVILFVDRIVFSWHSHNPQLSWHLHSLTGFTWIIAISLPCDIMIYLWDISNFSVMSNLAKHSIHLTIFQIPNKSLSIMYHRLRSGGTTDRACKFKENISWKITIPTYKVQISGTVTLTLISFSLYGNKDVTMAMIIYMTLQRQKSESTLVACVPPWLPTCSTISM